MKASIPGKNCAILYIGTSIHDIVADRFLINYIQNFQGYDMILNKFTCGDVLASSRAMMDF